MGQPILIGHHSEKRHRAALARSASHMDKGCESAAMAKHHEAKAAGIEAALESSIFSDDRDAIAQLERRIAEREAKRDRMKAINSAHKRFLKNPASLDNADLTEEEKALIRKYQPAYSWEPHPYPPYSFTNLGGNIRRDKQRIEQIKRQLERTEKAEQAGGVVIEVAPPSPIGPSGDWCRVTFAEKPDRAVLNALKAAGFYWSAGSWQGRLDCLPKEVRE